MATRIDLSKHKLEVDRSGKFLHIQIEELIRNLIKRGQLKKGDCLPPIQELAKLLKVNRITVQKAIHKLQSDGVVKTHQGKGTIVTNDFGHYPKLLVNTKLTTHMAFTDGSVINEMVSEKCGPELCTTIPDSEKSTSYQRIVHVNSKDGKPYGYIECFIPSDIYDADPDKFRNKLTLRAVVAHIGRGKVKNIYQTLSINKASKDMARHLEIPVGDPVAIVKRFVHNKDNIAVYVGNIVYPGDLIEMLIEMDPDFKK